MLRIHTRNAAFASALLVATAMPHPVLAAPQDYRFELAGKPQTGTGGKSTVSIRLVHTPGNKPVTDAVVFESKADMGPAGMPTMGAPVTLLPAQGGLYRVEVDPGMAGPWAIHLAAKVQGEAATVRGTVTADLVK